MEHDLLSDHAHEEPLPEASPTRTAGLFVGIVVIAAICFGIGYRLGKNSVPATAGSEPVPAATASNVPKPSAAVADSSDAVTETVSQPEPSSPAPTQETAAPSTKPVASAKAAAPELAHPAAGSFAVQVAAISKPEDADALVNALRKKNYPVFVVTGGDKLFHVQVGPFASLADAEAMRSRLAGDGYNPILKK
jgi:cell division septation protein DedD